MCLCSAADDNNEEWDGVVRKTEGGRVQGRAVVSRIIGQRCGGCREAQMERTLPLCNRNADTGSHTYAFDVCSYVPRGCFAFSNRFACAYVFLCCSWR